MKNRDIEKLFKESKELVPTSSLKERVLSAPVSAGYQAEGNVATRKLFYFKKLIAIAMALIILFSGIMLCLTYTGYGSVYIDVNPSIELTLNRWNKIVDVQYLNADAELTFAECEIKGKRLEAGMDEVMDALKEKGYLEEAELSIGVYCKNQKRADKLLKRFSNSANKYKQKHNCKININGQKLKEKKNERCEELGVSPVKYELILQIIEKDSSYTAEMLKDKTVKELKEILNQKNNKKPS